MKTPLIAASLFATGLAHGQIVAIWPTNYCQVIQSQNNLGKVLPSWVTESEDRWCLNGRTLTISHSVFYTGIYWNGSRQGGPKLTEDVEVWHQIGQTRYRLVSSQHITYWAQKARGGWIASTNDLPMAFDEVLPWAPSGVGSATIGNAYWRVTDTATPLLCACTNIANGPYLVKLPCMADSRGFEFRCRFEGNEGKSMALGLAAVNEAEGTSLGRFTFALDELTDEALPW